MKKASTMRRFASLMSVYSLGGIIENALGFLLVPLYTAYLFPDQLGIISLLTITVQLLTTGISGPHASALARYYYDKEYKDTRGKLLTSLFVSAALKSLVMLGIYLGASSFIATRVLSDPAHITIVKIYGAMLFFRPLNTLLQDLLRLNERAKYFIGVSLSKIVIKVGIIVTLLTVYHKEVLAVAIGETFAFVYVVVMTAPIFLKHAKPHVSFAMLKRPLKYGYHQIFSTYSNFLIQAGDRYILRIFDTLNTVGLYSFGYSLAAILDVVAVTPVKNAILPLVMKLQHDMDHLRGFLKKIATHYYMFICFIGLGFALFSKEFVQIISFRDSYHSSWVIIPILALSYAQHALGNFVGWGTVIKEKGLHNSAIIIVGAAVNIILNFLFIPLYGMLGAAFATLVSYIVWNVLKIYYSKVLCDIEFELTRLLQITIYSVCLFFLGLKLGQGNIVHAIIMKSLVLCLYPLYFMFSSFLSKSEKRTLTHLCRTVCTKGLRAGLNEL